MASRRDAPARVTLVVGDEPVLVDRAVRAVRDAVRRLDPGTEVHDLVGSQIAGGRLAVLAAPSLFGGERLVILRDAHEVPKDAFPEVLDAARIAAEEELHLVVVHPGGARGKALLDKLAPMAERVDAPKITKPRDRLDFVRRELRDRRRTVTDGAAQALVDAVGSNLAELVAACSQLVLDTEGTIDEAAVARYHRGRAEVSGFAVADAAIEGRAAEAIAQARWALGTGTAPVLLISALASALRGMLRLAGAPGGLSDEALARDIGVPPWKVNRLRQQSRGWTMGGLARAHAAVAEADGDVKGGAADAAWAVERAVMAVLAECNATPRQHLRRPVGD